MTGRKPNRLTEPRILGLLLLVTLPISGCDTTTDVYGAEISAYLAQVSVNGVSATQIAGEPPASTGTMTVQTAAASQMITGGSAQVSLDGSDNFEQVAIKVDGIDGYYLAALSAPLDEAPMIVTIGSLPPELQFAYSVAVAGSDGAFGPYSHTSVSAMEVIGGDIQVSVAWSTLADVDLHVIDPTGEEVYYGNRSAASGGELDLDANAACSTSSIFQENIGWPRNTAPSGEYIVRVDYWSSCDEPETEFVVTVSTRPGVPRTPITPGSFLRTYTGVLNGPGSGGGAGDGTTIARFIF